MPGSEPVSCKDLQCNIQSDKLCSMLKKLLKFVDILLVATVNWN